VAHDPEPGKFYPRHAARARLPLFVLLAAVLVALGGTTATVLALSGGKQAPPRAAPASGAALPVWTATPSAEPSASDGDDDTPANPPVPILTTSPAPAAPATAPPPTPVPAPTRIKLEAAPIVGLAGRCLDVPDADTDDGTPVQMWTCDGSREQNWLAGPDETVRTLGKCLDVEDGGTDNGSAVQLFTCNGSGAQHWRFTADHRLINPQSGKCLDVKDGKAEDGAGLQIWTCVGNINQLWSRSA